MEEVTSLANSLIKDGVKQLLIDRTAVEKVITEEDIANKVLELKLCTGYSMHENDQLESVIDLVDQISLSR